MINTLTCGFIGLGLIGGSIAKAIRHHLPDTRLIAYDIHTKSLNLAVNEQVIDQICPAIDDSFGSCDYIFLCAPVSRNAENLLALKPFLSPETILTDVGSVKTGIHRQIEELQLQKQFIGGHPMAGSERFGYQNAKASLLENAYYILTPSEEVPSEKVEAYRALVESMGAIPLTLSYGEHDYVTAAISHLPHVIFSQSGKKQRLRERRDENDRRRRFQGYHKNRLLLSGNVAANLSDQRGSYRKAAPYIYTVS